MDEESDASLAALRELARRLDIYIHIGSLAIEALPTTGHVNRSFLIDPKGEIVARFDKIHMFDVDLADGERATASRATTVPANWQCWQTFRGGGSD